MKCPSCGYASRPQHPFEVIIHVKHFGKTILKSLQTVDSLNEAELIGLGMRHGAAACLHETSLVEDFTSTTEMVVKNRICQCNCHFGGFGRGGVCKQPCDDCDCPE